MCLVAQLAFLFSLFGVGLSAYRAWRVVTVFPRVTAAQGTPARVGILVGHWQSDSGAVCSDGLTEATITQDIAGRLADMLQRLGYDVDLLPEFSPKLSGYEANVLLSLHVDSCLPERSGFKVARATQSAIPENEDRLAACLRREYSAATGLAYDEATITADMTHYHAFYEIDAQTPAAIIELGFLGGDRQLLTRHQSRVVRGLAAGLVCYLQGDK